MSDDNVSDPKDNPVSEGHLPVSGEVGGPVTYHDPTTIDTNDNPDNDPVLEDSENSQ
ncbi:MAG: hypothetical protein JWP13_428 [Candidatus Saccharibacteria bacterium]|nr:hypothetical protein [Candidatus Saccharibacteria bacterium]